jgi:UDP-glucose 4-epimerase
MTRHILITGGAGFIGSHLAERLVARGDRVTALDDLSTGRMENLAALRDEARFRFVLGSVEDEKIVAELMAGCDSVLHLAAAVGVQLIVDEPVRTIRSIIHGTEVVLEAAHRAGQAGRGRPVLITSSSEVYGKGARVPFSEDDDVVVGATRFSRWCYAYSKGIDEFLGLAYFKQFGLPVTIARLFNTVGPRQVGMYGMVLPRFVEAALAGRAIPIYGDGTQTRCFCHVDDVADAVVRMAELPAAAGQVFNLGSDQEVSINDLARRVIDITGSKSRIQHVPIEVAYGQQFDDLPRRVPQLDKVKQAIGFVPRYDLDSVIRSVVEAQRATGRTNDAVAGGRAT